MLTVSKFASSKENDLKKLPQRMTVYLTRLCNMKCPHCLLRLYDQNFFRKDEMELSHAKTVLSHFFNKGVKQLTVAAFGEVFLYPYFNELVRFARELGFKPINTVTNGLILDQYLDYILDYFEAVNISLDGYDDDTYSKHRGGNGIFEKVTNNINELVRKNEKQSKQINIAIVHVVYEENLYDIEKMIELAEKLKVNRVVFKNFHPVQGNDKDCTPLHANRNKTVDYLESIMELKNYAVQIVLPSLIGKNTEFFCSNLFNDITIGSGGFYAPCCQIPTEKKYGNFFDDPDAIFKNEILNFKKSFLEAKTHSQLSTICRQCQALNLENYIYFPNQKKWKKRYLVDNFNFGFMPVP